MLQSYMLETYVSKRYFLIATIYASLYFAAVSSHPNGTDMTTFGRAMIASLQIQSTIGFAAPSHNHWAKNWRVILIITFHSLSTILFNIFLLGTLFARLSSAKNRAMSVRISSMAVVRQEEKNGYPFLEFRIGEIRKHQLLNLRMSVDLFSHKGAKLFHRHSLAIEPSGGMFLAVPTEIRHVIDETSPLWHLLSASEDPAQSFECPVCGDMFESKEQLVKHLNFTVSKSNDAKHSQALKATIVVPSPTLESFKSHLRLMDDYWEIIVMVEGTEPVTGSPIQVRHSFTVKDLIFGLHFKPCWRIDTDELKGKKIIVDFKNFDAVQ